jgi:ERF superfamily
MTDQPPSLAAALLALQADLPRIPKTVSGQHGRYAAYDKILARVRPVLAKHGFLWHTVPTMAGLPGNTRFVLVYCLEHVASGERITGSYPLAEGQAQQQGSQISYAKRYALVAVLDLEVVGEDDDGMDDRRELDVPPARMRDRMTPTKTTGTDHEQLRGGAVEPTPDDRPADRHGPVDNPPVDKWTDALPGEFDIGQPEGRPGSIDPRGSQMRNLQRAFQAAGITDRVVRLGMASDMIGRQITTANQLSQLEADYIIRTLKEGAQQ